MTRKAKAVESAENQEEQVVLETTQEIVETPVEETTTEESETKDETEQEGVPIEETEVVNEEESKDNNDSTETNSETIKENIAEGVVINDGAEGDAGQSSLNDIPVDFEDISRASENDSVYVDTYIKLENILTNLKDIQDNDISFTKNEDLAVLIEYVEQAVKATTKLRE